MKFKIKSILFLGIVGLMAMSSCKKQDNISLQTRIADIPLTVSNVSAYFPTPAVQTTLGTRTVKIILNIPAGSGRTIKEITRVAAATSPAGVQTTNGLYNTAPIAGNGSTSVTFTTTLDEYKAKVGPAIAPTPAIPAAGGAATSFLPRNFYFMVTLDNGQILISTSVRVYVDKDNV